MVADIRGPQLFWRSRVLAITLDHIIKYASNIPILSGLPDYLAFSRERENATIEVYLSGGASRKAAERIFAS